MGANSADISRNMYDEEKEHQQLIYQQGTPPVDADFNDAQQIAFHLLRRFIQTIIGDGTKQHPKYSFEKKSNPTISPLNFS